MDALGWLMLAALVVGLAWADRTVQRIDRVKHELESRRQARQAHETQRKAASVRLVGAKR